MQLSMILDLVLLVVLAGSAFFYARRGFAAGIVQMVGSLISLVTASVAASRISPAVFENFFKNSLVEKTRQMLENQNGADLETLVERFAGFLPDSLKQNIIQAAGGLLDTAAPNAALTVVENVIAPLLVPIISIVVFFVTFALCRLIISLVVAMLTIVNRIPLVGSLNRLLGFVTGLGAGAVNVFILLCAAWALVVIMGGNNSAWNEQMLQQSRFYQLFAPFNPFV